MPQTEPDSPSLPITDLLAEFVAKRLSKKAKKSKHKKHKSHHKHKSSAKRKSDEYDSDDSESSRSEKIRSHKKSHHKHRSRSSSRERYKSRRKHRSRSPSRSRKDWHKSVKKRRYSSSQDSSDERTEKTESTEKDEQQYKSKDEQQYKSKAEQQYKSKGEQQYKSKDNQKPVVATVTNEDSSVTHLPPTASGIQIENISSSSEKVAGEVKSLNQMSTPQQDILSDRASAVEITDNLVSSDNTKDSEKTLFNVDIHAIVKDVVNNVISSKSEKKGEGTDITSSKTDEVTNSTSLLTTPCHSDQSKDLFSDKPTLCKDSDPVVSSETSKDRKYKRSSYAKDSDDNEDDVRYHKRKKHSYERDNRKSSSKWDKYESEREKKFHDQSQERKNEKYQRRNDSKERKDRQKPAEDGEKIDKNKLLEVARRNVLNMIEKGTLPQGLEVSALQKEQFLTIKSGGNSVKELTDFCRTLSEKDGRGTSNYNSTITTDESHDEKDQPFIHHPFKVKEASVIKLNIKNAIPLPVKTHAEKVTENARTLTLQFPVSSGNQHRQKELEWIPVEKNTKPENSSVVSLNSFPTAKASIKASEKDPVSYPIPVPPLPSSSVQPSSSSFPPLPPMPPPQQPCAPPPPLIPPPPVPFSLYNTVEQMKFVPPAAPLPPSPPPRPPPPPPCQPVFPMSSQGPVFQNNLNYSRVFPDMSRRSNERIDLHAIVTQRFKALQKLQENPFDLDARSDIEEAQIKMQAWIESQQMPGQFTGSTNVKLLSPHELCGPRPVWVKKDIFTKAAPVTEGKGMSLLRKMGWNPGEGLGKNKEGTLEPLFLDIKMDKKGLVAEADKKVKILPSIVDEKKNYMIEGKHPVSMLMELCSKKKWPLPLYTEVDETGPAHKKLFLYKVQVNNVEYQPAVSRKNKKLAKADAAVVCLKAMGLLPSNYGG